MLWDLGDLIAENWSGKSPNKLRNGPGKAQKGLKCLGSGAQNGPQLQAQKWSGRTQKASEMVRPTAKKLRNYGRKTRKRLRNSLGSPKRLRNGPGSPRKNLREEPKKGSKMVRAQKGLRNGSGEAQKWSGRSEPLWAPPGLFLSSPDHF